MCMYIFTYYISHINRVCVLIIPEIQVNMTRRITGDRLPCWGTRPSGGTLEPKLSDNVTSSCVPVFIKGKLVRHFQADIFLPPGRLTLYQVGVVNHHVDCDEPLMVVMTAADDCGGGGGSSRRQRQCHRKPQYDVKIRPNAKTKTCVFQCFSRETNDRKVTVTVQFHKKPGLKDTEDKERCCEIEAYIFWTPIRFSKCYLNLTWWGAQSYSGAIILLNLSDLDCHIAHRFRPWYFSSSIFLSKCCQPREGMSAQAQLWYLVPLGIN